MTDRSSKPALFRFWAKVDVCGKGGCWNWLASVNQDGYGRFTDDSRATVRAHRFAYEYLVGPIPEGMLVCHRCDNPRCVNPAHLFLGSNQDNTADRGRKGRSAQGPTHGARKHPERWRRGDENGARLHPEKVARGTRVTLAKLTDDQVREIRRRYAAGGVTQTVLAEEFGVDQTGISAIVLRKTWRHVV